MNAKEKEKLRKKEEKIKGEADHQ